MQLLALLHATLAATLVYDVDVSCAHGILSNGMHHARLKLEQGVNCSQLCVADTSIHYGTMVNATAKNSIFARLSSAVVRRRVSQITGL